MNTFALIAYSAIRAIFDLESEVVLMNLKLLKLLRNCRQFLRTLILFVCITVVS